MRISLIVLFLLVGKAGILAAKPKTRLAVPPVYNLQCEHLIRPLGIDNLTPRLSWQLNDERRGALQFAYQVIVGTDSADVAKGRGNFSNAAPLNLSRMLVSYDGAPLQPFTRYFWKVVVWDMESKQQSSDVSWFETGMMQMSNWQGAWIADWNNIDHRPAPYFRKQFSAAKEIQSARAYIAVAGLYELSINGKKVGDHRLDPLYTRFDRRNLYVTHDVTAQLKKGENAIGVILGNGWYNHQSLGVWDFHRAPWRRRPTFCFDLRITYTDGTVETFTSGLDWKTSGGAIVANSIYTGEQYDARLEQKGWNEVGFDDSKWNPVGFRSAPSDNIVSQQVVPIRNVEKIKSVSLKQLNDTTWLYDFGRNMAGVTEIHVGGEAGTIVRLKHGERLGKDGHLDLSNINVYFRGDKQLDPYQVDILTLSGRPEDQFMPRFNYKGFRYVEVTSSRKIAMDTNSLTAWFMHSDVRQTGHLKTSDPLITGLWNATNNSYLSNLMGYPTDCPQREKNGWTGDAHFAIETALYNYDGITVYEKWLADHRDEQQPNGVLPDIIPTGGWGYSTENGLDWTSTIAIIPWQIYQFYGDSKALLDNYENIKCYVDYVDRTYPNHLSDWGRGDWVPVSVESNIEFTSSIYFYVDTKILAEAAIITGNQEDIDYYSQLAREIREAINAKFLNRETGVYASGTQTELSMALYWGIVPVELVQKVADNLASKVKSANFHLDVGVLGAKALLSALSQNGHAETAYKVAVQNTYPSWGWWVKNGATTLVENWDLQATRDISDNHMMFGEIGAWLFKGLGGIQVDEKQPGFKHVILRPYFPKDLKDFEVSHQSPYGTITSGWTRKGKEITYTLVIPPNSSATFYLPDGVKGEKVIALESGTHVMKLVVE